MMMPCPRIRGISTGPNPFTKKPVSLVDVAKAKAAGAGQLGFHLRQPYADGGNKNVSCSLLLLAFLAFCLPFCLILAPKLLLVPREKVEQPGAA